MHPDLRTEVWDGTIEYHKFKETGWFAIGGVEHPMFKTFVHRILTESKYINEYSLYVIGGLLEDWMSWDIDFAITGKYDPKKIKEIFEVITAISFQLRLFADCHYQHKLWPIHLYSKHGGYEETHDCWRLSNNFKNNDNPQDLSGLISVDGLYKHTIHYPFPKHIKKLEEGHQYNPPLLLN